MKIENNALNPLSPKKSDGLYSVDKNNRPVDSARVVTGKDKVEFSDRARLLSKARASFDEASGVRTEQVSELRAKVDSGQYTIPYEDLARKLLPLVRS